MYLVLRDGALGCLGKLINSLAVVAKILLAADEDNRETLAEVQNLRNPLLWYVSTFGPLHTQTFLCFGICNREIRHPPSPGRCRANRVSPQRNRSGSHVSRGMREDGDGRNLPGQQYPKERARRACYQPRHRRRSSRRLWGRRPDGNKVRLSFLNYASPSYIPVS